jgi:protein AbiQ
MKLYEVNPKYINYLAAYAPHLFRNKQAGQQNERKYIGVILEIHDVKYFAPLSSFKEKHKRMKEGLDFIKISTYAVININNMFPVPDGLYTYVDYSKEKNPKYKKLLMSEYRIIRKLQDKIQKNARELYRQKVEKNVKNALTKRCNDFLLLEEKCKMYKKNS